LFVLLNDIDTFIFSKGIRVSREDILKLEPGCRDDFIADFKASELFRMNGGLK
jgi:hypothetical protein